MELSNVCGLINMGNTCFLNSALQLLVSCNVLTKYILNNNFKSSFIQIYKRFLNNYMNNDRFSPSELIQKINEKNDFFKDGKQHDSHEFLIILIDILEEEFNLEYKSSGKKIVGIELNKLFNTIFGTKLASIIICDETNEKSKSKSKERILSLPIPKKIKLNLQVCMKHFLEVEELTDDNKWYSEKNNKKYDALKQLYIKSYPKYLIIHLKRFSYHDNSGSSKNNSEVEMNQCMKLKNNNYSLRAIIIHSGSTNGGHYISIVNKNNQWYLCNDSNITKIQNIDKYINIGYIYLFVKNK